MRTGCDSSLGHMWPLGLSLLPSGLGDVIIDNKIIIHFLFQEEHEQEGLQQ